MRLVLIASTIAAGLAFATASEAKSDPLREARFYSTLELRTPVGAAVEWCSFVTDASAKAAAHSNRFEPVESGWLRYRGSSIESLMDTTQSEDSYVEDSYTFGPGLTVKEVVRRGHYSDDPFITATFKPDVRGHLKMTARSRKARRRSNHFTYFLDWPLYDKFSDIPYAGLIHLTRPIRVEEACQEVRNR